MNCRHCKTPLTHTFIDLGFAPPSNAYLSEDDLYIPEMYYPLKVKVCTNCWLVQTEDYAQAENLFNSDYAYFSSTSSSWLSHAKTYSEKIIEKLRLSSHSHIVEIASNDGYLLKNFVAAGVPCLGIEPTDSTAFAAEKLGIPVLKKFFSETLAIELTQNGLQADLIIGNNVYAHVPDINDFTIGLKKLLKPDGTITLEFPHVMRLIEQSQFDTIYHEHFSYLSLFTVNHIFRSTGLRIYDVEQLNTHGGSLRIYGCHNEDIRPTKKSVIELLKEESEFGLCDIDTYKNFQSKANKIKDELLSFLIEQKRLGQKVVAYGAAAKGNTLLNYAGVKPDLLPFVYDAAPAKQGKYLPGSHIPILSPDFLMNESPSYLIVLPWNILSEVVNLNINLSNDRMRFVTAVPYLKIVDDSLLT